LGINGAIGNLVFYNKRLLGWFFPQKIIERSEDNPLTPTKIRDNLLNYRLFLFYCSIVATPFATITLFISGFLLTVNFIVFHQVDFTFLLLRNDKGPLRQGSFSFYYICQNNSFKS